MKKLKKSLPSIGKLIFLVSLWLIAHNVHAQLTTASISGKVSGTDHKPLPGATIQVIHEPSGTRYGSSTNAEGRYTIQGIRPGGPYKVIVSFIGMEHNETDGITLQLGETLKRDVELVESSQLLGEVVIKGRTGIDATKTGAAMSITSTEINRMPSITHGIADVIRLNPQVRVANNGGIFFAGTSNRYNSFQIDGVMNNDVYGLTTNGSNGGQAGTQPVSMETIEQIQINVAPFDIRQSGFTGGSINAITKSGTNDFHGTVYGFANNQYLIGSKYRMRNGTTSDKYKDQYEYQAGLTLGGAVVRNKLFFFANYERTDRTYQNPYAMGSTASVIDAEEAIAILEKLKELAEAQGVTYRGHLNSTDVYTKSDKAGLKMDWNISDRHKASFRWSMVSAKQLNSAGNANTLNASDYSFDFVSRTHSWVAELQSCFSENISNELRLSYVRVRDQRRPGAPFPMIEIANVGDGTLHLGNDRSAMANTLDQDIWSFTDNLSWYTGKHTLTFGTHNEFYRFSNLFIQDAYGTYFFSSPDDFYAGRIRQYWFAQANVDVTGSPRWAATFRAGQLGLYAQDQYHVSNDLDLTIGLRLDIPLFFDAPAENAPFNAFATSQGWNYKTNTRLNSNPLFSPRLGFRWNVRDLNRYIVRGGIGIFTGRIPFVWLSNNFANTGIQISSYRVGVTSGNPDATKELALILDPGKQMQNAGKLTASGSQSINVFDKNFRFPQNLRADIALDFVLGGIDWTAEAIYSKTLNNILYRNLVVGLTGKTVGETIPSLSFDRRPMLQKLAGTETYSGIYTLDNTCKGYTYNLSLQGSKKFRFGLEVTASYAYTKSMIQNDGNSSVAPSNWQYNYTTVDPNAPELSTSSFNVPHTIRASVFYTKAWKKNRSTTIGLIYSGSSGIPYSVCYSGDLNGDGGYNDLIYIPTDAEADQMNFMATSHYTAEQQKANFKTWLDNDEYLKHHRGEYFKRYGANENFEHHFDLHLSHTLRFQAGKKMRSLEFSLDIINIGNMLNKDWGYTSASYGYYAPVNYKGDGNFQFLHDANYDLHAYDDYYSRWRGQVGARFNF